MSYSVLRLCFECHSYFMLFGVVRVLCRNLFLGCVLNAILTLCYLE